MPTRRGFLAALAGVGAVGYAGTQADAAQVPTLPKPDLSTGVEWDAHVAAKAAHRATNRVREENGVTPLQWSPEIAQVARDYAQTMAAEDWYAHTGPNGSQPETRLARAGVACYNGENIDKTHWKTDLKRAYPSDETTYLATPEAVGKSVVGEWTHSPGHFRNLIDQTSTAEGIGMALREEDNAIFVVQDFC